MNENELELKLQELDSLQSACINCGLCLEVCSTYQATGWEHESPRGRIQLAKNLLQGEIHPSSEILQTFDRCLGCHACEKICPTRVEYHSIRKIVQYIRCTLGSGRRNNQSKHSRLQLTYRIANRFWRAFGWKWLKIDSLKLPKPMQSFIYNRLGSKSPEALTLIVGCFQDLFQHRLIEQTLRLLKKMHVEVSINRTQNCCGAIFERVNDSSQVLKHQRKCIEKFKNSLSQKSTFLSAGCQNFTLRQGCDPEKVVDLYALVIEQIKNLNMKLKLETPLTVYYQPYCAQIGEDMALKLLQQIEGLKIKTLWPSKSCCGGFCGEAFIHSEQANFIRDSKLRLLPKNAILIVISPDCWMQLIGMEDIRVLYPIQLILTHKSSHK